MSEVVPLKARPLPMRMRRLRAALHDEMLPERMIHGEFTTTGWRVPSRLSDQDWRATGALICDLEGAIPWIFADWWLASDSRKLPADWRGPSQRTLDNYAITARAFLPYTRRRANVSFKHHTELTGLSESEQNDLLDWCEGPQRPSVTELRTEKQRRAAAAVAKLPSPEAMLLPEVPEVEALEVAPALSVGRPAHAPEIEPEIDLELERELELPRDIGVIVYGLRLPADLHAEAKAAAAEADMTLTAWIVDGIIERLGKRAR